MLSLIESRVFKYKSIDDSGLVRIGEKITVFVGKNESGKTAFLEALTKSHPFEDVKFNPVYDYPKREYTKYRPLHDEKKYANVVELSFELSDRLTKEINDEVFRGATIIPKRFSFKRSTHYGNGNSISLNLDDKKIIDLYKKELSELEHCEEVFADARKLGDVISKIVKLNLPADSKLALFSKEWEERAKDRTAGWDYVDWHIWQKYLSSAVPRFFYFDDYKILPGKVNLPSLSQRKANGKLNDGDETTLGLLDLAGITLEELMSEEGYENSKAKLEAISLTITDEIFKYWTQNTDLSVEFDVRDDVKDTAPFNSGKNFYIRIKNNRHGVTVPFDQRSKGFIWFFSFMTWFSAVKERLDTEDEIILLLDEPGLSLHAMAQADFLNYINKLSEEYQLLYTTHSPFMIKSNELDNVRVVEDRMKEGTKISEKLEGSGDDSLFPLQAALGYTIAQNLFISERNVLVEGPADLIVFQHISSIFEENGKKGIGIATIVPVGGLDKLVTFISLLGANRLKIAVVHDRAGAPPQKIEDLIKSKIIERKRILDYSMYRSPENIDTDLEDLFPVALYLDSFNAVYNKELKGKKITISDLNAHPRIIERINLWLDDNEIELLKDGGFNHYRVAQNLIKHIDKDSLPEVTANAFEKMFDQILKLIE